MKKEIRKYLMAFLLVLVLSLFTGCAASTFTGNGAEGEISGLFPIASGKGLFGKGGFWDWLVYPMAYLMKLIGIIFGNNYAVMILFATIIVRSLAWPIYGKTNDMSLKMSLMQPELNKINDKYAGKTDDESKRRMQMEQLQLYKKYNMNFFGCLMPFLQMPIFLAFYETLRRIPYSSTSFLASVNNTLSNKKGTFTFDPSKLIIDADNLKTKVLGVDLLEGMGNTWNSQKIGLIIIAILVCVTQIGIQLFTQFRQNKVKKDQYKDVPEYRRPTETDQQKQQQTMMKVMIYAMPVMMLVFVLRSPAALGWYWLVGNIYTALQTFISSKLSEKKLIKLKEKIEKGKSFI